MFFFILSFLMGDVLLQFFSYLPSVVNLYLIGLTTISLFILFKKYKISLYVLGFILGFIYSALYAHTILSERLDPSLEGMPLLVTGKIVSLPVILDKQIRFLFRIESIQKNGIYQNYHGLVQLASKNLNDHFKVLERFRFLVRLKRIHGVQNPGSFDYEAWSFQKGLQANGYLVSKALPERLPSYWYDRSVDQLRQYLKEKMQRILPPSQTKPMLISLLTGERSEISPKTWDILQRTGTNHLIAIAGLHIGFIAEAVYFFVSFFWRLSHRLIFFLPAQKAGTCASLVAAVFYSALSGFSLPTQRACIMLAIFNINIFSSHKINSWHKWALALFIVLLINPLEILSESFWLSFFTIALIIYGMNGRQTKSIRWSKWGKIQLLLSIGLIPLTILFFQKISLISFFANSLAVPWLTFFILPFCFMGAFLLLILPSLGLYLLSIADFSFSYLWKCLIFFSHIDFSIWQYAIPNVFVLMSMVTGLLLLLLPMSFPGKYLGFIGVLPIFFWQPQVPQAGNIWLTLLDVGQGLSVVVQTQSHVLIFDAGPKYNDNIDMGKQVVVPSIINMGLKKIDLLVVSHADNDHIGGAQSILEAFPVTSIITSVPSQFSFAEPCVEGRIFEWDHVQFSFLYPEKNQSYFGNDSSCVLKINNGSQTILLPGDIEKFAETKLLEKSANQLATTILIAPHHGSRTSALSTFVDALHPQYVLYSTGYRNRYHFPHPSVYMIYKNHHAYQFNTAESGAIQIKIEKNKAVQIIEYRKQHRRYWMID